MKRLLSLVVLSFGIFLAACTPPPTSTIPVSVGQRLYQAQSILVTAQAGANAYAQQPWCSPTSPKPPACANPATVIELAKASSEATQAMTVAQDIAAKATSPQATILDKVSAAENAVSYLGGLLAKLK